MSDDSQAAFWEQTYQSGEYREHWDYGRASQELVSFVAAEVPQAGGVALDVGCGAGREAIFLAQCGFTVIGVDISPTALKIASRRASQAGVAVDWREGNFLSLPVDNGCVDFVNDRGAFHIVGEDNRPQFAAEIGRVLKPGGVMLLRGASPGVEEEEFTPITAEALDRHFSTAAYTRGPLLPIALISDAGMLPANIVVLRKR